MRGLGHLPDPEHVVAADLRERHVARLIGGAHPSLPQYLTYAELLSEIPDQGPTSACVGEALATAIFVRAAISGHPIPRPSAAAIYAYARAIDAPHQWLVDAGSRPTAAKLGMQRYGLVPESRWPLEVATINEVPPLDVMEHGLEALVTECYRIASGPGASLLCRMALARGFIPVFAMQVDEAYARYDGSDVYRAMTGPSLGGHMQAIAGYEPGALIVAGSWGASFGRGGFARIADEFIDSGSCSDFLVVQTVPKELT